MRGGHPAIRFADSSAMPSDRPGQRAERLLDPRRRSRMEADAERRLMAPADMRDPPLQRSPAEMSYGTKARAPLDSAISNRPISILTGTNQGSVIQMSQTLRILG